MGEPTPRRALNGHSLDASLRLCKGKAGTLNDLAELLQDFHRGQVAEFLRNQAGGHQIRQTIQNGYQILNRDEVNCGVAAEVLNWRMIEPPPGEPEITASEKPGRLANIVRRMRDGATVLDRWGPRDSEDDNAGIAGCACHLGEV